MLWNFSKKALISRGTMGSWVPYGRMRERENRGRRGRKSNKKKKGDPE